MTQIALIDTALVGLLESCDLPSTTVLSAPHAWDHGFMGLSESRKAIGVDLGR